MSDDAKAASQDEREPGEPLRLLSNEAGVPQFFGTPSQLDRAMPLRLVNRLLDAVWPHMYPDEEDQQPESLQEALDAIPFEPAPIDVVELHKTFQAAVLQRLIPMVHAAEDQADLEDLLDRYMQLPSPREDGFDSDN